MEIDLDTAPQPEPVVVKRPRVQWGWGVLLVLVLLLGAYLRFVGLDWDGPHHLHPDERFLTMVETAIQPVESLSDYFDTQTSTLNPANRGYGFYVYGTLPLFVVRYLADVVEKTGYDQVQLVGRAVSASADLLTVLLVYLIAVRLYRKQSVGVLAAAFSALAVLQIQQSHFFTVDTVTNFLAFLAFYLAVCIMTDTQMKEETGAESGGHAWLNGLGLGAEAERLLRILFGGWRRSGLYLLFGVALGMAVASKVSVAQIAVLLPLAAFVRYVQLPEELRLQEAVRMIRNMALAAVISLIVFRIFQPYAFDGPGFLGVHINERWMANMKELQAQSSGDADFPPALQWARRPVWYAWQNQVLYGMGLPLGLLAWAGFVWMGWRLFRRGEWKQHILIWVWTAFFFTWQSLVFNPTMRYLLPIYPTLAIIAAWALVWLWGKAQRQEGEETPAPARWPRLAAGGIAVLVLVSTAVWAVAFSRIYTRPVTRLAASSWIYQNIPGPVNLRVDTGAAELQQQPLGMRSGTSIETGKPLILTFRPAQAAVLTQIDLPHVVDALYQPVIKTLTITVYEINPERKMLSGGVLSGDFPAPDDPRGQSYSLAFPQPVALDPDKQYQLEFTLLEGGLNLNLYGQASLLGNGVEGPFQQYLPEPVELVQTGKPFLLNFQPLYNGTLKEVYFPHIVDWAALPGNKTVRLDVLQTEFSEPALASAQLQAGFLAERDPRGEGYRFVLEQPVALSKETSYTLRIELVDGGGALAIYGSEHANESTWDDALPYSVDGFNPYDLFSGIYRSDLNFEMYWDDNADKLNRFQTTLDRTDYIFISSNRQWGSVPRVPERYPLSLVYYRELLGCPPEQDVVRCYTVAQPGMFAGRLGFDLIYVNQSEPELGPLWVNTQFAEEAFTVYDHPKVLIFKKRADYDAQAVHAVLGAVDLSKAVHLTPRQASSYRPGMQLEEEKGPDGLLPADRLQQQREGGTWAQLFDRQALINRSPALSAIVWYLALTILGWMFYPLTRLVLRGLPDRGYPLTRLVAMLLISLVVWWLGSLGLVVNPALIGWVIGWWLLFNLLLVYWQRDELRRELAERGRYYLVAEAVFLALFVLDTLIRLGNPDLWHPSKGGEKPMDFSYFNAVLKSSTFPPYDPWFAGGYLNYYYYGFVFVGVLVKWIGIVPTVAYNLVLPTLFSMVGAGSFSIGWNLFLHAAGQKAEEPVDLAADEALAEVETAPDEEVSLTGEPAEAEGIFAAGELAAAEADVPETGEPLAAVEATVAPLEPASAESTAFWAGLAAALGVLILGNLGTVRMIWHGLMRLGDPGLDLAASTFIQRWSATLKGMADLLSGMRLPYPPGDWYWIPSRAIPGEPITEFPFFTFLYADLHAHMMALPLTVLALAWALSLVLGHWRWGLETGKHKIFHFVAFVLLGGAVIGALRPANTWDLPTYLALGIVALLYTALRYARRPDWLKPWLPQDRWWYRLGVAAGGIVLLVALAFWLYRPFSQWYMLVYNAVKPFEGEHTPVWSYLTHWGLFLFVIGSWMMAETIQWMSVTPLSALNKLRPYRAAILAALLFLLAAIVLLMAYFEVGIAWIVALMGVWAVILLLRSGQPDSKRVVLFMTGSGLALTLAVELVVLEGDIGRMNTVFKFYMQAWTLLALSAAAGLIWLLRLAEAWHSAWRTVWQAVLVVLIGSAALFPLMAGLDKITDRMTSQAPHTLDGMEYMAHAVYSDFGVDMNLNEDYQAIRWMQENIQGSPVIVEANTPEYRWGSRYTINTGLPGVVGWNWHQRQQRGEMAPQVEQRVAEVMSFYQGIDRLPVEEFLHKYQVRYIVVGQLERAAYPGAGLAKFDNWNGDLWREIYRQGSTVIYEVLP